MSQHIKSALKKLGQDEALLESVIDVIVKEWPAEEALLKKALLEKDYDVLRKSFHTLSGSVAYFSFELSNQFHDLSELAIEKKTISQQKLNVILCSLDNLIAELETWQRARRSA